MHNLTAGARSSRHLDNIYHQDLKVKEDADCRGGSSASPGSGVAEQSGDSRLQGLQQSTVKTSSVRRQVGWALVFHIKSMALHLDGLPDSPVWLHTVIGGMPREQKMRDVLQIMSDPAEKMYISLILSEGERNTRLISILA